MYLHVPSPWLNIAAPLYTLDCETPVPLATRPDLLLKELGYLQYYRIRQEQRFVRRGRYRMDGPTSQEHGCSRESLQMRTRPSRVLICAYLGHYAASCADPGACLHSVNDDAAGGVSWPFHTRSHGDAHVAREMLSFTS